MPTLKKNYSDQNTTIESIKGTQIDVLDSGFIRLVDYMGCDDAIVQAARVSYGQGTKKVHEDRGLIRYLMRHHHTTPFEMCEIKLHLRVPMDVWRQWIRHRTANVNEYSTRYSIAIDEAHKTKADEWRLQARSNRQGSEGFLEETFGKELTNREAELQEQLRKEYEHRLDLGIAREQARKDLPLSTYTEAYWKIDLHNLFHFLKLRMDQHAQHEIREYANVIGNEIVSKWCPLAWEAFVDYRLNAMSLSGLEIQIVERLASDDTDGALTLAEKFRFIRRRDDGVKILREGSEFEPKLKQLGFSIPWPSGELQDN